MTQNESIIVVGIATDMRNGSSLKDAIVKASSTLGVSTAAIIAVLAKFNPKILGGSAGDAGRSV